MSDKEEKKESKKKSQDAQKKLEDYLSDKQAGQYQLCNKQFQTDEVIVHAGTTDQNEHIIYVFGKYIPNINQKKELNQLKRYFYYFLDELVEQKYYLFYFHSGLSSYSYVQCMYMLMKKLPEKYYNNLQKFYIVNPSFLVKSYNFFNTPSALKNKLEYLKSVKHIYDLPFFKTSFYKKIQNYVKVLSTSEPKTSRSQDDDNNKKDKLFGLDLDDLELNDQQIPKIILDFINYFTDNEDHIKEPGIFRKAPREYDIKEMEKELINKNYDFIKNHEDPHVVASSFKRLLSQMPTPIFTYKQYELIKSLPLIKDPQEKRTRVHKIVEQIPVLNFRVLRYIIDLLRTISRYSDSNLMKMEALTKIFAPTLIRCQSRGQKYEEAIEELMMNPTVVEVVQIIYQDYDDIFSSRTIDEHATNNILNDIMGDLPENQTDMVQIENPYINQQQYNYFVTRDSNLYIGDDTDIEVCTTNPKFPVQPQKKVQSNTTNFIDGSGYNSDHEEEKEEEEEEYQEEQKQDKKIFEEQEEEEKEDKVEGRGEDQKIRENQNNKNHLPLENNGVHHFRNNGEEIGNGNQHSDDEIFDDSDEQEGDEEYFQIRQKSHTIQIDDPNALIALRALLI